MNRNFILRLLCAAVMAIASCGVAAELGQPAAPLKLSEWIKGKPVDLATVKGRQVVVVEFWATWCPPCRTSIPHLTELQKKFKDVVFLGISSEDAGTVRKFVEQLGDQMDYTVAIDDEHQTNKGYMAAFGQNNIPHAFIVDLAGRVVWSGHPMTGLAEALAEVVAGKYDLAKAKKRAGAEQLLNDYFEAATAGTNEVQLEKIGRELEALDRELGGLTPGQKFNAAEVRKLARFRGLLREYQTAVQANPAGTNLDRIERSLVETAPAYFNVGQFKETLRLNRIFNDYYQAAAGHAPTNELARLARQLADVNTTDGVVLNEWAWTLLTDQQLQTRDYALATKLARAAVTATGGKNAGVLDTYARALFDSGKTAESIAWQQKAIAAAPDQETKAELRQTLTRYESKLAPK